MRQKTIKFLMLGLAFFTTLLIVATSSVLQAENDQELPVTQIAPGVFVFEGAYGVFSPENGGLVSNMSFVIGEKYVAVIDTGGSARSGELLLAAIARQTRLPLRYVINTHMHPDHIFGNAAFERSETIFVGHEKLKAALEARSSHYLAANEILLGKDAFRGTRIVLPGKAVSSEIELDLGGRTLKLTAHPTAHTDNDLTVFDLKSKTLWTGDLLFVRHVPALDGSILGWLNVMKKLEPTDVNHLVPGHGPPGLMWPDAMLAQKKYLELLTSQTREFIDQGRSIREATEKIGASEKNNWLLFDEFNARNVAAAFSELEWE